VNKTQPLSPSELIGHFTNYRRDELATTVNRVRFQALRTLLVLLLFVVVFLIAFATKELAEKRIQVEANNLLVTHKQSIKNTIERLRHLPTSAVRDKDIIDLLQLAQSKQYERIANEAGPVNSYLEAIANRADASLFYVIDTFGNTIASSNWRQSNSLVGKNYSYRPYFKNALQSDEAGYFAIGTITREAGYYFAQPVKKEGEVIGVVVVKTELESLQSLWASNGDELILFDEHGVSVLASNPNWRFKSMSHALPEDLNVLRDENKYAGRALASLSNNKNYIAEKVQLQDTNYLVTKVSLDELGWRLWSLEPTRSVYAVVFLAVAASVLLIGLSSVVYLYKTEKQRRTKLRSAARDAENLRKLNKQLEAEISDRVRAQEELHDAQSELIQASKLAALGQMSAAIVHEVNQPLAAIRTFGASAKLLLERGNNDAVKKNLNEITALTERLATITTDLKIFARKPSASGDVVCVQECIHNVIQMLEPLKISADVAITHRIPVEPVYICGSAIRLELVISNLITNAIDATRQRSDHREIKLHLFIDDTESVLRVSDNGPGIDTHTIKHLFDPFFTTKPEGEGVGLGLAITYGIVQEFGGSIRVRNNADGGALFSLRLKQLVVDSALNTEEYSSKKSILN